MRAALLFIVSHIIFFISLPFFLLHPKIRSHKKQRLGLPKEQQQHAFKKGSSSPMPRIWLHGASAGDLLALKPLLVELREHLPQASLVISTITNSGLSIAEQMKEFVDDYFVFPYDLYGPVNRILDYVNPDIIVLEYTELWPTLIHQAHKRNIKLVLHNGRLSQMNMLRYKLLFKLIGNLLTYFSLLLMRDDAEAQRALSLQAPTKIVRVTGNSKFDNLANAVKKAHQENLFSHLFSDSHAPIWACGSIHQGEEQLLVSTYVKLKKDFPDLKLALAPRYLEKAFLFIEQCKKNGLTYQCRTSHKEMPLDTDVFILDTIGELMHLYMQASVVFVGGSFTKRGGQNILEPAACGKAVLYGPHMENFADSVHMLQGRGGIQATSISSLEKTLHQLLANPHRLEQLGQLAKQTVSKVSGASQRNATLITKLLQ